MIHLFSSIVPANEKNFDGKTWYCPHNSVLLNGILKIYKPGNIRMMKKILLFGTVLTIACFIFSCEDKECTQSMDNQAGFGFYTIADSIERDTSLSPVSVYGKTRPDTLLYDSSLGRSNVRLPLNPTKDFSHFVFSVDSLSDTIQINYTRELKFISHSCGFITDFHIQTVSTSQHHFDSVNVTNHTITQNENEEHFKIYLSPPDTTGQ